MNIYCSVPCLCSRLQATSSVPSSLDDRSLSVLCVTGACCPPLSQGQAVLCSAVVGQTVLKCRLAFLKTYSWKKVFHSYISLGERCMPHPPIADSPWLLVCSRLCRFLQEGNVLGHPFPHARSLFLSFFFCIAMV